MGFLKNKFGFIIFISLVTLIVLVVGAFSLYQDNSSVFSSNGYILETSAKTKQKYYFSANTKYKENVDDKKTVTIKPGACQYGPYVTLTPGKYQIRYVGDNLNSKEANQYQVRSIYSEEGTEIPEVTWPIVISIQESNRVIYTVEITKTSPNTEFMLYNPSTNDKDISVKFIEVIRLT